jgi:cell division protein FtsI (penicillin-binding protein 3)
VLDAETGEVVAMASLPSFDPARPGEADSDALFNRASLGVYEMGSVFKIFTTAMALDQGAVSLQDGYDVSRPIRVARFTIRDFKPKNRWLSVPEIFIYSSNIGTVQMAMESGTPAQQAFLGNLGLTRTAQIEVPEVGQPMVPSPWREINTMTISYGHGLAVSPLQMVSAVAAVVNGGDLVPATLLKRDGRESIVVQHVLSPGTSRDMRWLMRLAVQNGTGRMADAPGYLVGGKTGTADKLRGRRYARNARIASFIGAFPMDRPRYVVFAMVDEPKGNKSTYGYATGGWVAAPLVRRVIERMGPLLGIQPKAQDEEEGADRHLIPVNLKGTVFAAN